MFNFLGKLVQSFAVWKVPPSRSSELAGAQVILGQSFGYHSYGNGLSNRALAKVALDLSERYGLPMVMQWEIAESMPPTPMAGVIYEHRIKGRYLDTYEVLAQSWHICQLRGWRKAIVVAHPDHMWRVVKTAQKLGFEVLVADVSGVPYDENSAQKWTRSRMRFVPREIVARLLFLLKCWM